MSKGRVSSKAGKDDLSMQLWSSCPRENGSFVFDLIGNGKVLKIYAQKC